MLPQSAYKGTLQNYIQLALTKSKIDIPIGMDVKDDKQLKFHIIFAKTLRTALGPVIERFLLLDRVFYLKQYGLKYEWVTIFDPSISPRNQAIVGIKTE